jgi:hypothetical protein
VLANCARHCFKNCGHVSPFVVPLVLAACHCSPHCFMTVSALAAATVPKAIIAANKKIESQCA